jgi:periplasmic protein TonB
LLQLSPLPATPLVERFRTGAARRTLGISFALLIEALLLLLLLTLSSEKQAGEEEGAINVVPLKAVEVPERAPDPSSPERAQRAEERPMPERPATEEVLPPRPAEPLPVQVGPKPTPPTMVPMPQVPAPSVDIPRSPIQPAPPPRPVYGPPDKGGSSAFRDTERVGTAPNGEPLYAAAWYREPKDEMLRPYLSTASGPGWGLIACRTAPDYRVEDCVALDEYPHGSQINRAVIAAAWEFKVRPPRLGGRLLVGSWVRIRIDYGFERR